MAAAGEAAEGGAGQWQWKSRQSAETTRSSRAATATTTVPRCSSATITISKWHCADTSTASLIGSAATGEKSAEASSLSAAHPCSAAAAACDADPVPAARGWRTSSRTRERANVHERAAGGNAWEE